MRGDRFAQRDRGARADPPAGAAYAAAPGVDDCRLEFFAADGPDGPVRFKARLTGPEPVPGAVQATVGVTEFTPGTEGLESSTMERALG